MKRDHTKAVWQYNLVVNKGSGALVVVCTCCVIFLCRLVCFSRPFSRLIGKPGQSPPESKEKSCEAFLSAISSNYCCIKFPLLCFLAAPIQKTDVCCEQWEDEGTRTTWKNVLSFFLRQRKKSVGSCLESLLCSCTCAFNEHIVKDMSLPSLSSLL